MRHGFPIEVQKLLAATEALVDFALNDASQSEDEYCEKETALIDDAQAAIEAVEALQTKGG